VRTDSTLAAISDKDFERGMSRINQEVAAEPEPQASNLKAGSPGAESQVVTDKGLAVYARA
jgi:hypothetical protein